MVLGFRTRQTCTGKRGQPPVLRKWPSDSGASCRLWRGDALTHQRGRFISPCVSGNRFERDKHRWDGGRYLAYPLHRECRYLGFTLPALILPFRTIRQRQLTRQGTSGGGAAVRGPAGRPYCGDKRGSGDTGVSDGCIPGSAGGGAGFERWKLACKRGLGARFRPIRRIACGTRGLVRSCLVGQSSGEARHSLSVRKVGRVCPSSAPDFAYGDGPE